MGIVLPLPCQIQSSDSDNPVGTTTATRTDGWKKEREREKKKIDGQLAAQATKEGDKYDPLPPLEGKGPLPLT